MRTWALRMSRRHSRTRTRSSCLRKKRTRAAGSCLQPPRVVLLLASELAPVCVARPSWGLLAEDEEEVKRTRLTFARRRLRQLHMLGGLAGSSRALFPVVSTGPIMAGTHQKDSCSRCTGKLDYLGDDLIMFPYHRNAWTSVLHATRQPAVLRFSSTAPLSDSHLFDVVLEYRMLVFSWIRFPEMFLYRAMLGSTVDTNLRQSTELFRMSVLCLV